MSQRSEILAIVAVLIVIAAAAAMRHLPELPRVVSVVALVGGVGLGTYSLWLWYREQRADPTTRALSRAYLREFAPAMLGYTLAVWLSVRLLRHVDITWARALIALLPVLPIAWALRATARYIRGLDEMQRRIELEAVALGSICVAFAYLTGGFLQAARVIDISGATAMFWVLPSLTLAYGVAKRFVVRHYGC